jgi:hypothetical protein
MKLVNGSWVAVGGANPSPNNELSAVSVVSSSDAWAVGQMIAEHWDGNSWSAVNIPSVVTGGVELDGVTIASDGTVWIVGQQYISTNQPRNGFVLTGNAGGITVGKWVPLTQYNILASIIAIPGSSVWAVGATSTANSNPATNVTTATLTEILA